MQCEELNKEELRKNSIFLLSNDREDRDFEFFVFIDPDNEDDRLEFLKELHHCLCKCNWTAGQPDCSFVKENNRVQLEKWLKSDGIEDRTLINPLSWLKIAIERYPYRLFVVIDKKKWEVNDRCPLDKDFWFRSETPPDDLTQWLRSPFVYKRICWIDKERIENLNSRELKKNLYSAWGKHLIEKINSKKAPIPLYIGTRGEDKNNTHIPATLPDSCFKKADGESSDFEKSNLVNLASTAQNGIIFRRHGALSGLWNESKNPDFGINWDEIIYFESISGSQFQFPLLSTYLSLQKQIEILQTALFSLTILDERYMEWSKTIPDDTKKQLLYTHIFPVSIQKNVSIETGGCASLEDNLRIAIPCDFLNNREALPEFIKSRNNSSPDILVIHQGIVDKMKHINIIQMKNSIPYILITSGRGYPPNLPYGVKFIPFSLIQFFLMRRYYEKFLFIKAVMRI